MTSVAHLSKNAFKILTPKPTEKGSLGKTWAQICGNKIEVKEICVYTI